ncbi:MAG: hypothetical protein IPK44_17520 [Candidatus Accumulibacter sp.]|nr:hypothetical protein [Accumulibacter sp.]
MGIDIQSQAAHIRAVIDQQPGQRLCGGHGFTQRFDIAPGLGTPGQLSQAILDVVQGQRGNLGESHEFAGKRNLR